MTVTSVQTPRRAGGASRPPVALVVVAAALAAVLLVPLGYVVSVVLDVGWDTLEPLIFRPRVGELLVNTVLLVVLGVPLTVLLGVGGAWLVERTTLPARRFWAVVLVAPLAIPAFVSSYGWASAVPSIHGLGGGLLVSVLAYYPLVYLPAMAAIRGLDPALEESARSLGLGSWAVFGRVVLPQLRLAILGGGLIVALHLLAEYGAFAFIRFDTFTTAIVVQYQSTFAGPAAGALGVVLSVLCLSLLIAEAGARGRARYARIGSGAARTAVPQRLGAFTPLALLGLAALGVAAVAVPLASVVRWLGRGSGWTQPELPSALTQTVLLAGGGALAAVLVALPLAWLTARHPGPLARLLEGTSYVAASLPAIIVALALVTVTLRVLPGLYQTAFTVVLAYVMIFLPRALVPLRSGIAQAPVALEEMARSLGYPPLLARLRVTVPLLVPSLAAGAALVGLGAANELTATLLLAPNGTRTLATQFWSQASAIDYPAAAPYAVLLILLSVPAVALMFAQSRRWGAR
ncbi:iron ABC transporter permease [Jiangella sp. DSM 45060]|uniref:ABC transporter permease n=1 Tax=Jiangella sp. DSM 45060 TaxID=1798224 RepID=UPI00087CED5E|nr:iron ABC transporter permease [Jiangella sp. DSM 45060]SDT40646.1 iron(III) transport system permease protein [Jiangella sp. DSM 45060]